MKSQMLKLLFGAIALTVILAGCDLFNLPMNEAARADAFIASVNENPQVPEDIRAHFHPTEVTDYANMNTQTFWDNTAHFSTADGTKRLSGMSTGGTLEPYSGTTSYSGTLENANGSYSISFAFLPDPLNSSNMLIRAIVVTGDTADTLENVR